MNPLEISVLLTQADRQAYLAAWTQRMQARAASNNPLSWLARVMQRPVTPNAEAVLLGPGTLRFDVSGLRVRNAQAETLHAWTAITEGTATQHHLFLWDEALSGLIVPIRDLPTGMNVRELQQRLEVLWTAAKNIASATDKASRAALGATKTASA
jgi:hypothetical protein